VQQVVAQIPWRSNIILMDKLPDNKTRLWYAQRLLENGWSSNVLDMIKNELNIRVIRGNKLKEGCVANGRRIIDERESVFNV
jgi:hypothetical protein